MCWNARYSKQELLQDNEIEKYVIKHGLTLNIYHSTLLRIRVKLLKKMAPLSKYIHSKQKYSDFKYESYNYNIRKLHYLPTRESKDSKSVIEAIIPEEITSKAG